MENFNSNTDLLNYYKKEIHFEKFKTHITNFNAWGKRDECCNWIGKKVKGYGRFYISDKYIYAHRIAYYHFYNKIPFVCRHKCRNKCVNPLHLENGNHKDNATDRTRDGTLVVPRLYGEKNPMFGKKHTEEAKKK